MDPEANYEEQRQLYGSTDPANVERRAELVDSMSEWVRHGGFKPAGYKGPAWEPCKEESRLSRDDLKVIRDNASGHLPLNIDDLADALGREPSSEEIAVWHKSRNENTKIEEQSSGRGDYRIQHPHLGKFESSGKIGERLHEIISDGGADDQAGDVNGPGDHWYGLILHSGVPGAEHAVVSESSQGFFEFEAFDTAEAARADFERIASEIAEEEEQEEAHEEREESNMTPREAALSGDNISQSTSLNAIRADLTDVKLELDQMDLSQDAKDEVAMELHNALNEVRAGNISKARERYWHLQGILQ